jgi:hypothetical protein
LSRFSRPMPLTGRLNASRIAKHGRHCMSLGGAPIPAGRSPSSRGRRDASGNSHSPRQHSRRRGLGACRPMRCAAVPEALRRLGPDDLKYVLLGAEARGSGTGRTLLDPGPAVRCMAGRNGGTPRRGTPRAECSPPVVWGRGPDPHPPVATVLGPRTAPCGRPGPVEAQVPRRETWDTRTGSRPDRHPRPAPPGPVPSVAGAAPTKI